MSAKPDSRTALLEQRFEALRHLTAVIDQSETVESFAVALAEYLARTFNAGAASLVLVDPRTDELVFLTGRGVPSVLLNKARLKRGQGVAGWVAEHHEVLNIQTARDDERFCSTVDDLTGFFTRSILCAPLYRTGQLEGAIEVLNRTDGEPFTDDDARFLEIIAEQVELLVANARLIDGLQRRNRELSTLIGIDRAVNAVHDLNELLGTIIHAAAEVSQATAGSIVLVNPETGKLSFFQAIGPAGGQLLDVEMEPGSGIVGACINSGQSLYVPDAYEDDRFHAQVDATTGFRTRSLLCVPLNIGAQTIGALEMVNLPETEDPDALIGLLEAFASQAALALDRAKLTQRLARRADAADEQLETTNQRLGAERARLTAMISQMADAVIMIDSEQRLLLVNRAARQMFQIAEQELEGQSALAVQNIALAAVLAVTDTEPQGMELRLDHPEPRTLRIHAATVHGPDRERLGRVVVCADITELKELAELRSEVVSFVSHELRTPLTSIKGFAGALLGDPRMVDADLRNFVRVIDHECDRLRRMVADLLCMSRLESGRPLQVRWQRLNLCELIQLVVEAQNVYATRHLVETVLPETALLIEADQDKLEQVLTNLLNNAIKYSDPGTAVEVAATIEGEEAVIRVADEGFGIAPEDLPNLFQQYGRLADAERRHIRGTGLGLYLSKHLVEAHGGTIEVSSELGRGSVFTIRLPRQRPWE